MDRLTHKAPLLLCLISCYIVLLSGCISAPASLDPKGEAAVGISNLGWIMFALGSVIWVIVVALLGFGLFRRRDAIDLYKPLPANENQRAINLWVISGGIVIPTLILISLIVLTVNVLDSLPAKLASGGVVVDITGHQWWWEVKYPGTDIILTDEMRIPAGQPVEVRLSSADVIHSLWVPELHGKFDLIPGRTYEFVLQADQPGEYKGRCAEFCGLAHAHMTFVVIAMNPQEFTSWFGGGEN